MADLEASSPDLRKDGLPRRVGREVKVHSQAWHALRRARRAAGGSTVIVGPWSSEVGYELLYWIPFVRRLLRDRGVSPERVAIVSRGGAADWYGDIGARYVDLLDWLSPGRLLEEHNHRIRTIGGEKQLSVTPFETEVLERVREQLGDPEGRMLHPSTMYRRWRAVWMRRRAPVVVEREVDFAPIEVAARPPDGLAEGEYIAVKPYFSSTFPASPENRARVGELVERLARHAPVVLLGSGGGVDGHEHPDVQSADVVVPDLGEPRSNLAAQTAIVRGARMLVATFGGFSYLGPFTGVPTCAFYSSDVSNPVHLEVLRRAERRLGKAVGSPGYLPFDVRHLPLVDQLAGAAAVWRS